MWDEPLMDSRISEGKHDLRYVCANCSSERVIPLSYFVQHQLVEHHGQGVDGCITEQVYMESDIPEMVQCGNCGHVERIKMRQIIFEDPRNSVMNARTGDVIEKGDMSLKYPIAALQDDLQRVFDSVTVEPLGLPVRA